MTPADSKIGSAVAVGVFDGLHLGHEAILSRALGQRPAAGRAVVVSFDPHPDLVLSADFHPVAPLTPQSEKRARVESLGFDALDVVPFTRELAALSPERFVQEYLLDRHRMRALVVGENFALGRARAGNLPWLRSFGESQGFVVEAVPLLERIQPGSPLSHDAERLLATLRTQKDGGGDESALRARVATDPADLDARLGLGRALAATGRYEDALACLLEVVRRDRQFADEGARKAMIDIFAVLGSSDPLTDRYRSELAKALFR